MGHIFSLNKNSFIFANSKVTHKLNTREEEKVNVATSCIFSSVEKGSFQSNLLASVSNDLIFCNFNQVIRSNHVSRKFGCSLSHKISNSFIGTTGLGGLGDLAHKNCNFRRSFESNSRVKLIFSFHQTQVNQISFLPKFHLAKDNIRQRTNGQED